MNNELYVARYEKIYRKLSDGILFDIRKINWNPPCETLEKFREEIYCSIIKKYKELKKTREFKTTGRILYAKSCSRNIDLAFVCQVISTENEIVATNNIGWGLSGLLDEQKINPEPFNFKLLIVGYRGLNEDRGDDGEPMPILDKVVNF